MRFQSFLAIITAVVVFGMLGMTFYVVTVQPQQGGLFSSQTIRGVAVVKDDKPYTLNFEQQQRLMAYLDRSLPQYGTAQSFGPSLPIQKIVFYSFNGQDWELSPRAWDDGELVFFSSLHQSEMRDSSQGRLFQLLEKTYD